MNRPLKYHSCAARNAAGKLGRRLPSSYLRAATRDDRCVEMKPSKWGNGLFASRHLAVGEVLLGVPREQCLIISFEGDKDGEIMVPKDGTFPRLMQGLGFADPLTWDMLLALALLDAVSGEGGSIWQSYALNVLPSPDSLTVPFCWSQTRLGALDHPEIIEGAQQQQQRLTSLFPALSQIDEEEDEPSWMAWAFACVRSRAYRIDGSSFGLVPHMDLANHSVQPNSNFRTSEDASKALELVALKEIKQGDEIFISYTGPEGYTNQRLMSQYGFVLPDGNPADRIAFDTEGRTLQLERLQLLMGDQAFLAAISGEDLYSYASLKSLPLIDENRDGATAKTQEEDSAAAVLFLSKIDAIISSCHSTLDEDEAAFRAFSNEADVRDVAAVAYRIERKRLLRRLREILALVAMSKA
jgi:hypothetical protein